MFQRHLRGAACGARAAQFYENRVICKINKFNTAAVFLSSGFISRSNVSSISLIFWILVIPEGLVFSVVGVPITDSMISNILSWQLSHPPPALT